MLALSMAPRPAVCSMVLSVALTSPRYLSSDKDPLFRFQQWNANLRIIEVTEVKTVPYVPLSHPFVERLIATIRREFLDQVPFWSATDLERKLLQFNNYYNREHVHQGIVGQLPDPGPADTALNIAYLDKTNGHPVAVVCSPGVRVKCQSRYS